MPKLRKATGKKPKKILLSCLLRILTGLACHADGPPSNTVFTKASYIPGPKPAVTNNDSIAGPVSFVLALSGPDAVVS